MMNTDEPRLSAPRPIAPEELEPLVNTQDADQAEVLAVACNELVARLREQPPTFDSPEDETIARWASQVTAEDIADIGGAISGLIRRTLLDALVAPRRHKAGDNDEDRGFGIAGRLEGLKSRPYFEVTPQSTSILASENGIEPLHLHVDDFAFHLSSRCGMSHEHGRVAWLVVANALPGLPELLPDLVVRDSGQENAALEVRLRT